MPKILIGIHDNLLADSYSFLAEGFGYSSNVVNSLDGMASKLKNQEYQRVLMDLNLGNPNKADISSAEKIFELVVKLYGHGNIFLGVSHNSLAVQLAHDKKIPAITKDDYEGLEKFLKE